MSRRIVASIGTLVATATAISGLVSVTVAPSSHAAPPAPVPLAPACDQYAFNGKFVADGVPQDIGRYSWQVFFTAAGPSAGTVPAAVTFSDGGQVKGRVIGGGIEGRSINFQIKWGDKPDNVWKFWGTIDDNGIASGAEDGPGSGAPWRSPTALACATPAPAQKPMARVTSDVDIYNIAHDDVDTGDGVVGAKIGTLRAGQQVELAESCQPNAWCKIVLPDRPGVGFVLGHLQF